MAIYLRALIIVALLFVISALPAKEQKEESQVDLVAIESLMQSEIVDLVNDDITRIKRQRKFSIGKLKQTWLEYQNSNRLIK